MYNLYKDTNNHFCLACNKTEAEYILIDVYANISIVKQTDKLDTFFKVYHSLHFIKSISIYYDYELILLKCFFLNHFATEFKFHFYYKRDEYFILYKDKKSTDINKFKSLIWSFNNNKFIKYKQFYSIQTFKLYIESEDFI